MSTFTLTGQFHGETRSVTWTDGELTGDDLVCKLVKREAAAYEGEVVGGPPHESSSTNHLANPWSALELCRLWLGYTTATYSGDLPVLGEPPEGRIY